MKIATPTDETAPDPQTLMAQVIEQWTQAQAVPMDAWFVWLRAVGEWQQELWDEWAVRFAGGVPIDG